MKITQLKTDQIESVVKLYNDTLVGNSIYKPIDVQTFKSKFIQTKNSYNLVLTLNEEIIGFGNSVYKDLEKTTPGFVTIVLIKENYQRKGYGSQLLKALEEYLINNGKTFIRQLFLNPILLEWYIPDTQDDHPGAPGVEFDSPWLSFLLKNDYQSANTHLDAYYLNITNYERP